MTEQKEQIGEGEVQFIKENNFAVNGLWYNNQFQKLPSGVVKGSNVKFKFVTKGSKNYWKKVKLLDNPNEIPKTEVKTEEKISVFDRVETTTLNTLIMVVKDVYISRKNEKSLEEVTLEVMESYKKIKEDLYSKKAVESSVKGS